MTLEPRPRPHVKRRLVVQVVVAASALAVVAALGWMRLRWQEWPSDGPARLPWAHGYVVRYRVGQVFTDGLERIKLTGNRPGVLRRVEITGPSVDHFRVVGVLVSGPHRKLGSWEVSPGFPPRKPGLRPLMPAEGAPLATGMVGTLLLIGMQVVKPGLGIRTGVKVYYTVGSHKYSVLLPASIANCPASMTIDACQAAYLKAAH